MRTRLAGPGPWLVLGLVVLTLTGGAVGVVTVPPAAAPARARAHAAALAAAAVAAAAPVTVAPAPTTEAAPRRPTARPAAAPAAPAAGLAAVAPAAPDQPVGQGFPPPPPGFEELQVPAGHGASISLTFDDGPSAQFTPQVLALLHEAHAAAVFCVIGRQAAALPALVQQDAAAGALCDHSRDHDLHMRRRGAGYESAEVSDGLHQIQAAAPGVPVPYYRQPGGLWDADVVAAAQAQGLDLLRWSDDPRDWSRPGAVAIAQRVLLRLQPGGVVLLHDGGGDRTQTVEALTWLLRALPAAGWHFTLPSAAPRTAAAAAAPE